MRGHAAQIEVAPDNQWRCPTVDAVLAAACNVPPLMVKVLLPKPLSVPAATVPPARVMGAFRLPPVWFKLPPRFT